MPSPLMRDKLADVKERKRAAQQRVKRAQDAKVRFVNRVNASGSIDTNSPEWKLAQDAGAEFASATAAYDSIKDEENFYIRQISGESLLPDQNTFMSDPGVMTELARLADSRAPIGSMNLGAAVTKDDLLARYSARRADSAPGGIVDYTGAARTAPYMGTIPPLYRPLRLLDVLPTAEMTNKTIPYVQTIPGYGTAKETPELAIKPEASIELVDAEVTASTIAHWMKCSRQSLADYQGLAQILNTQLVFGVNDRVEFQVVGGDGEGDNILGILNHTGVGAVEYDASELAADQALSGITNVLLSNANPNGILLNPLDWQAMLKAKTNIGGADTGEYFSMGPFATTAQNLWGCPLIPSVSIAQGQALVGDWSRGCTLFIREGVNVRLSDSDQDDFVRNRVTLLGEGRFGLAVWEPTCFCVVDLA